MVRPARPEAYWAAARPLPLAQCPGHVPEHERRVCQEGQLQHRRPPGGEQRVRESRTVRAKHNLAGRGDGLRLGLGSTVPPASCRSGCSSSI